MNRAIEVDGYFYIKLERHFILFNDYGTLEERVIPDWELIL